MSETGHTDHEISPMNTTTQSFSALRDSLVALTALHEETEENARLAALLTGSNRLAVVLGCLSLPTAFLFGQNGMSHAVLWLALVFIAAVTMFFAHRLTVAPAVFGERMRAFGRELGGILLFNGFSWGSGAFLLSAQNASIVTALSVIVMAALTLIFFLRECEAIFAFLLPCVALVAFASILHPMAEGTLGAGLALVTGGALCILGRLRQLRWTRMLDSPAMLSF